MKNFISILTVIILTTTSTFAGPLDFFTGGSSSKVFPEQVHLVGGDSGLNIIDVSTNKTWMKFERGANNVITTGVAATTATQDGAVFVGTENGVIKLDYANDEIIKIVGQEMYYPIYCDGKSGIPDFSDRNSGNFCFSDEEVMRGENLRGLWSFDNFISPSVISTGGGAEKFLVADSSGYANHATVNGDVQFTSDGSSGRAATFDGADDYLATNNHLLWNEGDMVSTISVGAWVKGSGYVLGDFSRCIEGTDCPVGQLTNFTGYILFIDASNKLAFRAGNGVYDSPHVLGTWSLDVLDTSRYNHVVAQYDTSFAAGVVELYVNGVLINVNNGSGLDGAFKIPSYSKFEIGSANDDYHGPAGLDKFKGSIDSAFVSNKLLSAKEVADLYHAGLTSLRAGHVTSIDSSSTDQTISYGTKNIENESESKVYVVNNEILKQVQDDIFGVQDDSSAVGKWNFESTKSSSSDANTKLLIHGDGTTTAISDSSASSHTITANNNATQSTTKSKFGGSSLYFDGVDDYLTLPDSDDFNFGTGNFTIEAWVNFFDHGNDQDIYYQGADTNNQILFRKKADGLLLFHSELGGAEQFRCESSALSWSGNRWYHIAVVNDSGNCKIFRDGVKVADIADADAVLDSTASVYIGNRSDLATDFKGYIDELRVTKGVARYTANFTAPTQAFNEIPDASGNENNGAIYGDAHFVDEGPSGKAMSFDGTGDYITVPDSSSLQTSGSELTYAAWIKPNNLTGNHAIITKNDANVSPYYAKNLFLLGDEISFHSYNGANNMYNSSNSNVQIGKWSHIVVSVKENAFVKTYLNGNIVYENTSVADVIAPDSLPFYIGVNQHDQNMIEFFDGLIDEVKMLTMALTEAEVKSLYEQGRDILQSQNLGAEVTDTYFDGNGDLYVANEDGVGNLKAESLKSKRVSSNLDEESCVTDLADPRDGKTYKTVQLGNQCWMAENLDYDNGCSSKTWVNSTDVGWCGYYNGTDTGEGLLYQWSAAMNRSTTSGVQGVCPSGWHVPTHDEFTTLERSVCTSGTCSTDFPYETSTTGFRGTDEGSKLSSFALNGNNSSFFNTLMTGFRDLTDGSFSEQGTYTSFWSSLEYSGTEAWRRDSGTTYSTIKRGQNTKSYAFSVRCVRDTPAATRDFSTFTKNMDIKTNYHPQTKLLLHGEDLKDSSNSRHLITVNGDTAVSTSESKFGGKSMYFDVTADYLTLPDSDDWNFKDEDFTIDTWVNWASLANLQVSTIVSQNDVDHIWRLNTINTPDLTFQYYDGINQISLLHNTSQMSENIWYHVAVVRNGSMIGLYLDGVLKDSASYSGSMPNLSGTLNVGRNEIGSQNFFNGYLDELRITKGKALWTSNFTPPKAADYKKPYINVIASGTPGATEELYLGTSFGVEKLDPITLSRKSEFGGAWIAKTGGINNFLTGTTNNVVSLDYNTIDKQLAIGSTDGSEGTGGITIVGTAEDKAPWVELTFDKATKDEGGLLSDLINAIAWVFNYKQTDKVEGNAEFKQIMVATDEGLTIADIENKTPPTPSNLQLFTLDGQVITGAITTQSISLKPEVNDPDPDSILTIFVNVTSDTFSENMSPTLKDADGKGNAACASGTPYLACVSGIWYEQSPAGDYSQTPFNPTIVINGLQNGSDYKAQMIVKDNL